MKIVVSPCRLNGEINAVSSKSMAHRLFICSALADGKTDIILSNTNNDIEATENCIKALGGDIVKNGEVYTVTPITGEPKKSRIYDCHESGSTLRFLFPVICALGTGGTFIGEGRLPQRPIKQLTDIVTECKISGESLPVTVEGKMRSGEFRLAGNVSSQYVSGLLFALPLLDGDSKIILTSPLESYSYVKMTLSALKLFGVVAEKTEYGFYVKGNQRYVSPKKVSVEGDWSSAAFFITANAIGHDVKVNNLDSNSAQGDKAVVDALKKISGGGTVVIDASDIPDLVPVLSVAACYAKGKTVIKNAARLRLKESDRLYATRVTLNALGADVTETDDGLIINGNGKLNGGEVDGFNDHRIVMSAVIAASKASGDTVITGAEAINKSYPSFYEDFIKLGGNIHGI